MVIKVSEDLEIKKLFSDILSKMSAFESSQQTQIQIIKKVDDVADKVQNLSVDFKSLNRDVTALTSKITAMESDIRNVQKTTYNLESLLLWKKEVEGIVTVNDLKDMKNRSQNISGLEAEIRALKEELKQEVKKDLEEVSRNVGDLQIDSKAAKRQALATGAGAGSIVGGIIAIGTAILNYFGGTGHH